MAFALVMVVTLLAAAAAVPSDTTVAPSAKDVAPIHGRAPRMVRHMVPIRERQDSSLCHYDVVIDHNPIRVPNRLDKVLCRKEGCKCQEAGEFRCTQVYAQLNVSYAGPGGIQFEPLDVEQACICSREISRSDLQAFAAELV